MLSSHSIFGNKRKVKDKHELITVNEKAWRSSLLRESWSSSRVCTEARSKCTTNTSLSLKTRKLDDVSSSRDLEISGKPDAMFSCHSESSQNTFSERDRSSESGNRFESRFHSVFRFADPANVGKSLFDGNKDHLLDQARSELIRQEHQVGSLDNCINELQQQAYAQRLELEEAHHGYIETRREQSRLHEEFSMKKKRFERLRYAIYTRWEKWRELKNYESTSSLYKNWERKSWDNTKAHFTNAGNARADEFYEWFRRISRSGIASQWKMFTRSQSTSSDSKFSFWAATNACHLTHGIRLDHRKTLWVINFLHLIRPNLRNSSFYDTRCYRIGSSALWAQELLSQEMKIELRAQFQCRHLQEGRRPWVHHCRWRFRHNSRVGQQRQQISELQFDKFPTPATFACRHVRYAFLKFVFTSLCQHTSQLASASLFGACVCLPLFSDARAAECAPATWHHWVDSFILIGQLILSTTLFPTVTKWYDLHVCAATCLHRRLMVLLPQVSCPAHCYLAVQSAHKSLRVPLAMSQVR